MRIRAGETGRRRALALLAITVALGSPTWSTEADDAAPAPQRAPIAMADRVLGGRVVAAPTQVGDDGLGTTGGTTYVVDVANRAIHVGVDLTATNLVPGTAFRYTYYDAIGVFTLAEATNVVATTADGQGLTAEVEPIDGTDAFAFIRIDLADRLLYRETDMIHLSYDLPDQGARSPRITRVNPAFAAVVPLPFGDPSTADIRVLIPDGLEVEVLGLAPLHHEDAGDHEAYIASAIADPLTWDASVVARDFDALQRTDPGGEHDVEVAAWPGDTAWSEFVGGLVRDGLPVLEELIGQPWPIHGTLDIVETVAPYLYGYAGWYDSDLDRIEVGDELEAGVVLHELAHAWFDGSLFSERWINEGFAEELSSRALERLGHPAPPPAPIDPAAIGAIRLSDWSTPTLSSAISDDQETYGYNASFGVIRALADEVGLEGLARVVDAASHDLIAYQGDPAPEAWLRASDWRRLLDLAEEVGGSAAASQLFAAHVVTEADLALLTTRAEARAAYDALEAAGAGWTPPLAIRRAMGAWDFAEATAAMAAAQQILTTRDAIAAAVSPLGLDAPRGLEVAYEEAQDLAEVTADADALLAAVDQLVAAHAAADEDRGLTATIGLLGGGVDDELASADRAFRDGDARDVLAASHAAQDVLEGAGQAGLRRIGALLALALIGVALHQGRRAMALGADEGALAQAADRLLALRPARRRRAALDVLPPPAPAERGSWPPPHIGSPSDATPSGWPPPTPPILPAPPLPSTARQLDDASR